MYYYPYVDGVYWKLRSRKKVNGRPVARFVGIQIARKKHSEAEPQFLEVARRWITDRGWHPEFEMVWIVELRGENERKEQYIRAETEDEFKKRKTIAEDKAKRAAARLKTKKTKDATVKTPVGMAGPRPAFIRVIVEVGEISDKIGMKLHEVRCADEEAPKDTAIRQGDQSSEDIWPNLSNQPTPERLRTKTEEETLGLSPKAKAVTVPKTSVRKKAPAKAVPKKPQAKKTARTPKQAGKQRIPKQPAADSLDDDTFDSSASSSADAQSDTEFKPKVKATGGEGSSSYLGIK